MASSSKASKDSNPIKFFMVYQHRSSQQLKVLEHLNVTLPPRCKLASRNGNWSVKVKSDHGTQTFTNGWSNFVRDNSLEPGNFLVFIYDGASMCNVKIYGLNGCEKPGLQREVESSLESEEDSSSGDEDFSVEKEMKKRGFDEDYEEDPSSGEDDFDVEKEKRTRGKNKGILESEEDSSSGDEDFSVEKEMKKSGKKKGIRVESRPGVSIKQKSKHSNVTAEKDRAAENFCDSASEYPNFKLGIQPVYLNHASLNLPMAFARKYMKLGKVKASLQVLSKSWPVKLTLYPNGCCKMSAGWLAFARDNHIQEGDNCLFEIIDMTRYAFKVTISKC